MTTKTPSRLKDARKFIETLDLSEIEAAIAQEARARLIIIGPVNSGKSTLFNRLKGQKLSEVSAVPGTTTEIIGEHFGPFTLLDTPGLGEVKGELHTAQTLDTLDRAHVAVLVLDAMAGIRQSDADLYHEIQSQGIPVVVALNKIDLVRRDLPQVIRDVERKMNVPVVPISAKKGTNVAEDLIPAIIDAHPQMAVTIGRALPRYRKIASRRVIREAAAMAAVMGAEPIPGLDIPLMIAIQVRMLLRLATIYGEEMSTGHARELISAVAGGVAIRYAAQETLKFLPGPGWLIGGAVAATGTTALGNVVIAFFEYSQKLTPDQLRKLYRQLRWKRKQKIDETLIENIISGEERV